MSKSPAKEGLLHHGCCGHCDYCNQIYSTTILPVVLYGCETWSPTLKEERRSLVSENRVLRIFEHKTDEVTVEWRKQLNEELNDMYSSPNIVRCIKLRRMRWAGHVACMGERKGVYRVLVGKLEWRRPLGRFRRRSEDNIEMDLQEVRIVGIDWIELARDRDRWWVLVHSAMNLRVP